MLTFKFIPHEELAHLEKGEKIKRILQYVKDEKIVLLDGSLHPDEESQLVEKTMEMVDRSFKGIEFCSLDGRRKNLAPFERLKKTLAYYLLNKQEGITVIGPASVIKEIKKDPTKIELLTNSGKRKK